MKYILALFLLSSCLHSPSNAIEELGEEVIKKKEGLEIRLQPIDESKSHSTDIFINRSIFWCQERSEMQSSEYIELFLWEF